MVSLSSLRTLDVGVGGHLSMYLRLVTTSRFGVASLTNFNANSVIKSLTLICDCFQLVCDMTYFSSLLEVFTRATSLPLEREDYENPIT